MAYAQTNYSQLQGKTVNGVRPKYSIAQIGCFITAFCNLEERFGRAIDPPTIDNELARLNLYIDVDDGVYDDVGWSTVSAFDPTITVVKTGSGAPADNNSIVKFSYRSSRTGVFTTHFSLVVDAAKGLIVDSWDGVVKSWNGYGGPVAYATYAKAGQPAPTPQGGEMTTLDIARILSFGILGRTGLDGGQSSLSGAWDQDLNANHVGKDTNKKIWEFYDSPEGRNYRDVALPAVYNERNQLRQTVADLKTALANEQAKPPKEIIKEVEKIVEVPVEVIRPVEVIKEPGWFIKVRSWINEFLNKK